ncbi:MAG: hypothetical protein U5L96_10165 [Owenweeksia sp.]|nr:hypothetical protein [Owenweeksia sp.]
MAKNDGSIKYPSIAQLRAEDSEEKSYLLFIIKNEQGEEVNRFTKAPQAGIQRVSWDGSYSSTAKLSNTKAPLTQAGSANLALPGTYTVSLYLSENGTLNPLGDSRQFALKWLENNTLQAENRNELLSFQKQVEEWRRKVNALEATQDELEKKASQLKAATRNTPGAALAWLDSLHALQSELADLKRIIHGDATLSKRHFATPPSLMDRLGSISWNSYSSTSAPTGTQKKNLRIVADTYAEIKPQLTALDNQLKRIQEALEEAGAPYLKGEMPE